MSISRQTGWSNESNLLWYILNQIKRLTSTFYNTMAATVKTVTGTGVNNTDPTNPIVNIAGAQDLYIPVVAMWPRITAGSAGLAATEMTTSLLNIQTLDFDQTIEEFVQFTIVLPRNWNNGTVTAKFYWTAASGTGGVAWKIAGGAYSDDDSLTTAFGTAQSITDTLIAANDLHVTSYTSAITIAGTPQDSDFIAFQISRDVAHASDTLTADAKLLGIVLTLTTDSATAA